MQLRDFLPPVLIKGLRAARHTLRRSHTPQTFDSYEVAASHCRDFGYETTDLVEVVCRKTAAYRDRCQGGELPDLNTSNILALLGMGLAHDHSGPIRVIDFGGACGAHYFLTKALFAGLEFKWHVVETPAMAQQGRELSNEDLKFFDSLNEATAGLDRVDVVYTSGALQYVSDPCETLIELINCRARYLVLARLGLSLGNSSITSIQESRLSDNGPGPMPAGFRDGIARYPVTFASKLRIESLLSENYEIMLRLPDTSVASTHEGRVVGIGYVAELRDTVNSNGE